MLVDYKPLFKNKNFLYLWSSQILSQLTIQIINFLLLVKIYTETGSTIATAFLWVSYALPAIIIGPIASASVDIVNKRNILMLSNLMQAIVVAIYALSFGSSLYLLYAAVMTYSFFNQFYMPAELAVLPSLVKTRHLAQANGLFLITQQLSIIIGFSIGSPLGKLIGFKNALLISSALLFSGFVSVSLLPPMKKTVAAFKKFEGAFSQFFRRIIFGYKFIKGEKKVFWPLALLLGMQVGLTIIAVNGPVIAEKLIGVSVESAGLAIVIPGGIGAIAASAKIPKLLKKGSRKMKLVKESLLSISVVFVLLSLLLPLMRGVFKTILGTFFIFELGYCFVSIIVPAQTFLQEKTPASLRGRVFGSYGFLLTIISVFPVLFSGTLTDILGVRFLMLTLGAIFLFSYSFITRNKDILFTSVRL
jgi:MFS family permease